jgi:MoxR-like ATPase
MTKPQLIEAVNLAIYLTRPLLLRGDPGCGKSSLAGAVAYELGLPCESWQLKSTSKVQDGLYNYDNFKRLHDAQLKLEHVNDPTRYIRLGPIGRSFQNEQRTVVLIDNIDRANVDFPYDLLLELDKWRFVVEEIGYTIQAKKGAEPIIFITSNGDKPLPEAYLRRCLFHYIDFPSVEQLKMILLVHFPDTIPKLIDAAVEYFVNFRNKEVGKKLSIRNLLDMLLLLRLDPPDEALSKLSLENSKVISHLGLDLTNKKQETGSKGSHTTNASEPQLEASSTIEVFYSYSHKDKKLRDMLDTRLSLLKRQGVIKSWNDRNISAGKEWANEIDMHLSSAHIIMLLISPDFIDSDYCYGVEMTKALERHRRKEARVIPIILRPTDWHTSPFGMLEALPREGKPVTLWPNRDQAFLDIVNGIRNVIQELTQTR